MRQRDETLLTTQEFERLMVTVSEGWNKGDARTSALAGGARESAECFSEDAIYVEPLDKQLYHGRPELDEFFGGKQRYVLRYTPRQGLTFYEV